MRLIRAGKVIFTDETAPEEAETPPKLSLAERNAMNRYAALLERQANERARIQEAADRRITFKHTEPDSIYSPAGRVLNQFVAPKYKEKPYRQGHWAPYERR